MQKRVIVLGAQGGIGRALVTHLSSLPTVRTVYALSREPLSSPGPRIIAESVDSMAPDALLDVAKKIALDGPIDWIIVATGILQNDHLQPEKSYREISAANLQELFQINTILPTLAAQAFLPICRPHSASRFAALSARVGSITDNQLGGWYGYRASKTALNMIIKTLSIEVKRQHPDWSIVGLHPGTVKTALSAPFTDRPSHRLFEPPEAAANLVQVLSTIQPSDSGNVYAWDGQKILP